MNWHGAVIGLVSFLIIGIYHPIVIKMEYHWGKKSWPVFLVLGIIFIVLSFVSENEALSSLFGVAAFSSFWGIREMFEQEERVKKGWYPKKKG